MTVFGDKTWKVVIKVTEVMRLVPYSSWVGVFIRRGRETKGECTQITGHVRTQEVSCHLQAKGRGVRRSQPTKTLTLDF